MTVALIDGDIVAFRCAASAENDPVEIALLRADKLMRDIIEATQAEAYVASLTGTGNFRYEINPDYKANRKDKVPPVHLLTVQNFLIDEWGAVPSEDCEADDVLGILQDKDTFYSREVDQDGNQIIYNETVICSIDKDLLMIPGRHYNFVRGEFYDIDYLSGLKHFYKQALIGDVSDNIKGVFKVGPVKAAKLIDHLETEKDMYDVVSKLYNDPERLKMNLDCLWIMRNEGERWSHRFETVS